jgi:hypothetical protein
MNKVKLEQMEGTDTRDMKIKQEDTFAIDFLDGLASSDNLELGRLVDVYCVGVKAEVKEELKAEEKDDEKDHLDAMRVFEQWDSETPRIQMLAFQALSPEEQQAFQECVDRAHERQGTTAPAAVKTEKPKLRNKTGFVGVRANGNKWQAQLWNDGKQRALGTFNTKEEAAAVYDKAVRKHRGSEAVCNFATAAEGEAAAAAAAGEWERQQLGNGAGGDLNAVLLQQLEQPETEDEEKREAKKKRKRRQVGADICAGCHKLKVKERFAKNQWQRSGSKKGSGSGLCKECTGYS